MNSLTRTGSRGPLLLVHGVTGDNVYFEHTMRLTLALLKAGKPYELMLLPGTHMLAEPKLRASESARVAEFFRKHLAEPTVQKYQ